MIIIPPYKNVIKHKMDEENCDPPLTTKEKSSELPQVTVLTQPEKSLSDRMNYRAVRLTNQLTALLGSALPQGVGADPAYESCSRIKSIFRKNSFAVCALSVNVGFFSDPEDLPGLAHLLEHMVYVACADEYRRYKKFKVFVTQYNAGTLCESTTFYFKCPVEDLHRVLNIFSQFLVSPALSVESMNGEREIVDFEFKLKSQHDYNRVEQLTSFFMTEGNPARKFKWGSARTLKQNISAEELRDSLRNFHRKYYSANLMTLVILAHALPIEMMESCVSEIFTAVPNRGALTDQWQSSSKALLERRKFHSMYFVSSVRDVTHVNLLWELPPFEKLYRSKANLLIDFLLNHRGKGGLFHYLKRKLWVLSIWARISPEGKYANSLYSLYLLNIELSEDGFRNLFHVIETTFTYLKLVNDLLSNATDFESIFQHVEELTNLNFDHPREENITMHSARDIARNMHHFSSSQYLKGPKLFLGDHQQSRREVQELLSYLRPESVCVITLAKQFDHIIDIEKRIRKIQLDRTEEWFRTKFDVEEIPGKMVTEWGNAGQSTEEFRSPSLENPFVSTNFRMLNGFLDDDFPVLVKKTDVLEIWHKFDTHSKQPVASINIHFLFPDGLAESSDSRIMLDLFIYSLRYQLTEELYLATQAYLKYEFTTSLWGGLLIQLSGFSDKLPSLLQAIIRGILNFATMFNSEVFHLVKIRLRKDYYNALLDPKTLAQQLLTSTVQEPYHNMVDRYNRILSIHETTFSEFVRTVFASFNVQCLTQGNISREQTLEDCSKLVDAFAGVTNPTTRKPSRNVRRLNVGERCVTVESFNKSDRNNAVTINYYQWGKATVSQYSCLRSLVHKMNGRAFDTLRTKERLGYLVDCTFQDDRGVIGFTITVCSSKPELETWKIEERIVKFLQNVEKDLVGEERNEESVDDSDDDDDDDDSLEEESLKYNKLEKDALRNFDQIVNEKNEFVHHFQGITVTGQDMGLMLQKMIRGEGRRLLSLQVVPSTMEDITVPNSLALQLKAVGRRGRAYGPSKYYVMNFEEFKKNLDFYDL